RHRWGRRDFDQWVDRRKGGWEGRDNDRGTRVDRQQYDVAPEVLPDRDNRDRRGNDAVFHSDSDSLVIDHSRKVRKDRSGKVKAGTRKDKTSKAHSRMNKSSESAIDEESGTVEEEI
ncbi:MAG TPA: hypothetical protein V6C82_10810, partial [Chroococcales cyanobacterium]